MRLDEKVVELARVFRGGSIPHAFGGALALAYYAEPRATVDIDVNIFLSPDDVDRVSAVLAPLGVQTSAVQRRLIRGDGQLRLRWESTPVDLFFATDGFHFNAQARARTVPFGEELISILAAEDLMVCKAVFDRRKDWIDIEQMLLLRAGDLDVDDVRRWVVAIVGDDDQRVEHFDLAVSTALG
ncbi:MAG: hypothetical protein ACT4OX_10045 [Actinomycetota bacterium]